jgi:uncharacterized protein (TIGR02646 family)
MKHIQKTMEPLEFTQWKIGEDPNWKPGWAELDGSKKMKNLVKMALFSEQGGICCYCGIRLTAQDSHIEHFRPRHGPYAYPDGELEYVNILVSCLSDTHEDAKPHCGMKKGSSDPAQIVSPLDATCEVRFAFGSYGTIEPSNPGDALAENSINKLGLNVDFLKAHRRKALDASGLLDVLVTATATEIQAWADKLLQRQNDGTFSEFCFSTAYVLRSYA